MTKAGNRILAGAREALAHARIKVVPGVIVHQGNTAPRDWQAEATAIEREYAEAKAAMEAARRPAGAGPSMRIAGTVGLDAFGKARDRFEAAKARRTAFLRACAEHEA